MLFMNREASKYSLTNWYVITNAMLHSNSSMNQLLLYDITLPANINSIQFSEIKFYFFKCTTHNKTKILGNWKHCLEFSRMKLAKKTFSLHNLSNFRRILFLLIYRYLSLLLKMIKRFSWSAKLMASPFKGPLKRSFTKGHCQNPDW